MVGAETRGVGCDGVGKFSRATFLLECGLRARTAKVTIQIKRIPNSVQVKTTCGIVI
jgi:hypothetical protein